MQSPDASDIVAAYRVLEPHVKRQGARDGDGEADARVDGGGDGGGPATTAQPDHRDALVPERLGLRRQQAMTE